MIESLVLDASVSAAWVMPDECDAYAVQVETELRLGAVPYVPFIWFVECANVIGRGLRGNRLTQLEADDALALVKELRVTAENISPLSIFGDCFKLAAKHNLSVYDSIYLELAIRRNLPLATLDNKLVNAAIQAGVPVYLK